MKEKARQPSKKALPDHHRPYRVLLPLSDESEARFLLPLAEILVQEYQGQLIILNTLAVPEGESLSGAASQASRFREALVEMMPAVLEITAQVQTLVRNQNEVWDGIWETVEREKVDLLLAGWSPPGQAAVTLPFIDEPRLENPPCNVVAVRPAPFKPWDSGWKNIKHILMPVRGGPHSTFTLRIGYALAHASEGEITLLHVVQEGNQADQEQFNLEFSSAIKELRYITRTISARGEIAGQIIDVAQGYDVIVMGAPTSRSKVKSWRSALFDSVIEKTDVNILVVKEQYVPEALPTGREEPVAKTLDRPIALVVDKWFAENTYHSREFNNLQRLLALKEAQGVSISLGLPALNEEKTVGKVISTVKQALMDDIPLLDEIVLIDSRSQDRTVEIASEFGIPVYVHQEILPQYGSYRGKGEALWKSLYVLNGDIVAWIDTDISNIHPRFVYGVLGPLLRQPRIKYVKGFYRRPLREGDKLIASGGGRVTELTARPFFNLFFPELSGLIQPLSGEYAGRRSALERLPFFTGYGVETGLLIDLLDRYGLGGIAQVDLLERIHHNQPLPSLSKMSFTIMQVVLRRLEKSRQVRLLDNKQQSMNLIRYGQRRRYYLEPEIINEYERQPMIAIPEYCQKRGLKLNTGSSETQHHGQEK
jgi:glycosyltransferase involved in cell wall biosynthesis